jgi:PST family polysaccharide transporter
VSVPLMVLWMNIYVYPLFYCGSVLVGLLLYHRARHGSYWPRRVTRGRSHRGRRARTLRSANLVEVLGSLYSSAPLPLARVQLGGGAELATLGSADRLYRFSLLAVVALGNGLQGWVLESGANTRRRQLAAFLAHVLLGVVGAVCLAVAGTGMTALLFGRELAAPQAVMTWYAATFFVISVATPISRNVLFPGGAGFTVALATGTAAIVGVPAIGVFTAIFGPPGAPNGLLCAETIVLLICLLRARRM